MDFLQETRRLCEISANTDGPVDEDENYSLNSEMLALFTSQSLEDKRFFSSQKVAGLKRSLGDPPLCISVNKRNNEETFEKICRQRFRSEIKLGGDNCDNSEIVISLASDSEEDSDSEIVYVQKVMLKNPMKVKCIKQENDEISAQQTWVPDIHCDINFRAEVRKSIENFNIKNKLTTDAVFKESPLLKRIEAEKTLKCTFDGDRKSAMKHLVGCVNKSFNCRSLSLKSGFKCHDDSFFNIENVVWRMDNDLEKIQKNAYVKHLKAVNKHKKADLNSSLTGNSGQSDCDNFSQSPRIPVNPLLQAPEKQYTSSIKSVKSPLLTLGTLHGSKKKQQQSVQPSKSETTTLHHTAQNNNSKLPQLARTDILDSSDSSSIKNIQISQPSNFLKFDPLVSILPDLPALDKSDISNPSQRRSDDVLKRSSVHPIVPTPMLRCSTEKPIKGNVNINVFRNNESSLCNTGNEACANEVDRSAIQKNVSFSSDSKIQKISISPTIDSTRSTLNPNVSASSKLCDPRTFSAHYNASSRDTSCLQNKEVNNPTNELSNINRSKSVGCFNVSQKIIKNDPFSSNKVASQRNNLQTNGKEILSESTLADINRILNSLSKKPKNKKENVDPKLHNFARSLNVSYSSDENSYTSSENPCTLSEDHSSEGSCVVDPFKQPRTDVPENVEVNLRSDEVTDEHKEVSSASIRTLFTREDETCEVITIDDSLKPPNTTFLVAKLEDEFPVTLSSFGTVWRLVPILTASKACSNIRTAYGLPEEVYDAVQDRFNLSEEKDQSFEPISIPLFPKIPAKRMRLDEEEGDFEDDSGDEYYVFFEEPSRRKKQKPEDSLIHRILASVCTNEEISGADRTYTSPDAALTVEKQRSFNLCSKISEEEKSFLEKKIIPKYGIRSLERLKYPFERYKGMYWPLFQPTDNISMHQFDKLMVADVFHQISDLSYHSFVQKKDFLCDSSSNRWNEDFKAVADMPDSYLIEHGRFKNRVSYARVFPTESLENAKELDRYNQQIEQDWITKTIESGVASINPVTDAEERDITAQRKHCSSSLMHDHVRFNLIDCYSSLVDHPNIGLRPPAPFPVYWCRPFGHQYICANARRSLLCRVVNGRNLNSYSELSQINVSNCEQLLNAQLSVFQSAYLFQRRLLYEKASTNMLSDEEARLSKERLGKVKALIFTLTYNKKVSIVNDLWDALKLDAWEEKYWTIIWDHLTSIYRKYPPTSRLSELMLDTIHASFLSIADPQQREEYAKRFPYFLQFRNI